MIQISSMSRRQQKHDTDCVTNGMMPRVNKIINTVAHIAYWSIINIAIIAYVLSCDRVNSSRNLNN